MPVRVAEGRQGGALATTIGAGIRWAVDHGARIVNVSLASNGFDIGELGAIEYAEDHGVLVVGAAGNGGNTDRAVPGRVSRVCSRSPAPTRPTSSPTGRRAGSWVQLAPPAARW